MKVIYNSKNNKNSSYIYRVCMMFFLFLSIIIPSSAQLTVNVSYSGLTPVPAGQEMCFDVSYTWSSTTMDLNGAKIQFTLPTELAGSAASDVPTFNSPHVTTSNYDPGTRLVTWNMVDPLPAGSSGTVKFCAHFPNGTTPNGTMVTITPTFSGNGQIPASSSVTVGATAAATAAITKSIKTDPALDNTATYTITVNNSQGNGGYNLTNTVISDNLPAGAVFISATNGGTESGGVVTWNLGSVPVGQVTYLKVKIKYPSGAFNVGDMVTNNVTMNADDPTGTPIPTKSASKTNTLSAPNPMFAPYKSSSTDWMSLNGNVGYYIGHNNNGNVPLTNAMIEDVLPPEFEVTSISLPIDFNGTSNMATVEYQTNTNSTYTGWVGSPFTLSTAAAYQTTASLGLAAGEYITKIKITYDELAVDYENYGIGINGKTINPGSDGVTYAMPKVINNTLNWMAMGAGQTLSGTQVDPATVVDKSPKPYVGKGLGSPYYQQPTNTVTYNFRIHNRYDASDSLKQPFLSDLLPPDISIDPTMLSVSGPIGAPALTVVNNFNGTGRQLLKFNWPTSALAIGGDQYWSMNAKIKAGAPPGDRNNLLMFMGSNNPTINTCDNNEYIRDTFDIDGDGRTLDDTLAAASVKLNIIETTAIEALKLVKGQCDTVFHKFPKVGKTLQGGTFQYRLSLVNVGNKPLTKIKLMDILPWVGDVGVITHPTNRESKYDPTFVSLDSIASGINVLYSASTNPCRADLDPAITEAPGCTGGTFSATPMADPQSLLFDFGTKVIQPADSVVLYWTMRVPYGIAPGDVAWNSFGHRSESTTGTLVPPAEPIKVGVTVKSAQIGNFVWLDTNKDGKQDAGELGVAGVVVNLLDANMNPVINPITMLPVTDTTDANGQYYFNVNPGSYFVKFDVPSGYGITLPNNVTGDDLGDSDVDNNGKSTMITVVDGTIDHSWDAGLVQCNTPVPTFVLTAATCTGSTPNNDGKITLSSVTNANKYGINAGATYTGPLYASATAIAAPVDVQTSILNAGGTYTIRLYNQADNCFLDTTIIVAAVTCTAPCIIPNAMVFTQTAPTCSTAGAPNNDGKITLTSVANADKYGINAGATYTGPAYASATAITTPVDVQTAISNAGGTYTIRLFSTSDTCFRDTTIIVASVTCTIPCIIPNAIVFTHTAPTCSVAGAPNNDGKITLTSVANADKYGINAGATYTGPAYASATAITTPVDVQTAIANAGGTYTIRLFSTSDACFKDTTITVASVTCTIPCVKITLGPNPLPSGQVGTPYSVQITATGGVSPYLFLWYPGSAGPLPAGLTMSSSGLVSGIPTTAGSYSAKITVLDANMCPDTLDPATITIKAPCIQPSGYTVNQTAPTCTFAGAANNDGKLTLTAIANADKYLVMSGSSITGTYASATAIGTTPVDIQTAIPNAGATYTVRFYNGADTCFKDTTIIIGAVTCVPGCVNPVPTFTQTAATCSATGVPNNDGKITLTAYSSADKYEVSVGATYTGGTYASATNLGAAPLDVRTAILNAGGTFTIRLFNGSDACIKDTTIIVAPVTCTIPCVPICSPIAVKKNN